MDWEKCVRSNFLSEATQVFGWVSVYSAGENSFFFFALLGEVGERLIFTG